MTLALFRSTKDPGIYGFSADATGSNLPDESGPWCRCSDAVLTDGGMLAGLANSEVLAGVVERKGFYLARLFPPAPPFPLEGDS